MIQFYIMIDSDTKEMSFFPTEIHNVTAFITDSQVWSTCHSIYVIFLYGIDCVEYFIELSFKRFVYLFGPVSHGTRFWQYGKPGRCLNNKNRQIGNSTNRPIYIFDTSLIFFFLFTLSLFLWLIRYKKIAFISMKKGNEKRIGILNIRRMTSSRFRKINKYIHKEKKRCE